MKLFLTTLLLLAGYLLLAQTEAPSPTPTLERVKDKYGGGFPAEMMCDDPSSTLQIISCEGEDRDATPPTGDNNPGNGAFMTWVASGSSTGLYYSQLIQGTFTTQIVMAGTSISVFPEEPGGIMDINLAIGGNTTNACLDPGTWTVRVWEVLDDNNDGTPDVDANGDIIGCFTECTFTFLPSCPIGQPFDVDVTDVGCTNGGSISLINFDPTDVYCDGQATFSWMGPDGFSNSSQNISNLAPGTYTFQLTDFYGCTTGPITVDVGTADEVDANCDNPQAPSVFGASDGSFDVEIIVGEGDYTITWDGASSGSASGNDGLNIITGLPAGDYDILITDDVTGCTTTCTITIPDPPCEVDFEVSVDNIGNIILTMTGGRPDFYVAFSGPATASQDDLGPYSTSPISLSANLFEPGLYSFTVYEADRPDCSNLETFNIDGPDCSTFEFTVENFVDLNCGGINDGAIEISLSGGTNPVLTWLTGPGVVGSNDLSIDNLGPGTYYFQAIDDDGCSLERTFVLDAPAPLLFDCAGVAESCTDANDGKIGVSITGGSPPFTLNYTATDSDGNPLPDLTTFPIADGDSIFNLVPGTYDLEIEDNNGCVVSCSTVVDEVVCPNISVGGSDQTVTLDSIINATTVDGTGGVILSFAGMPDWTYAISSTTGGLDTVITTAVSPDTAINLPIDTYNLTLIRAIDTIVIDSTFLDSVGVAACCISLGNPPMFDFIIRGPECLLALNPVANDPQCFNEPSGFIDLNVTGALGNITVDWSDPSLSGPAPGGVPAGSYSVTVTDAAGCTADTMVELFDPPPVFVDLAADQVLCAGDSTATITAIVTDAQGAVSYQWFPSGPDAPTLSGVPAGDYSVIITDAAGCTDIAAITVTEIPAVVLNCEAIAETNVGTADGQIFFDLSGGTPPYTFELNNLAVTRPALDTFRNLAPGEYTIEVFDANNCSTTCTAVVNPGGCGDFSLSLDLSQPDCDTATGTATVTPVLANGMVTYQWEHGPTTASLTDLTAGNYSVTATDAFSCTAIQEFTVTAFTDFPGLIVGDFATICDDNCADINITLSGPGPITTYFTVEQAGTQVQSQVDAGSGPTTLTLCPADYGFSDFNNTTVTFDSVSAVNGCTRIINEARPISLFPASTSSITPVICATDTFRLNGEVFHANRTSGDVILSGASVNGCDSTVTVNLSFFAPATGAVDPVICATDTFRLNGEVFHANRTSGDVILPGASANGCDSTVSVSVTFFAPATAAVTPTICATDTFFLAGQAFHANRTFGDVVLENASSNGCDSTISVNIDFFPQTTAVFDTTICTGTSFTYGGRVFDGAIADELITLPIPTSNGCDSLVSVTVRERAVPSVSISGEGVVCDDGLLNISISYDGPAEANVTLSSNPGEVISLVSGTTTIQRPVDIGETVTIVSAEDGGPCSLITSGSITVTASDMAVRIDVMSGDGIYAVSCAGGSDGEIMALTSGGVGPFVFDWNTGDDTQVVEDLPAGEYSLIVTSGRGCQASASVQLTEPDVLAVQIGEIDATCLDANPALVVQNVAGGVGPYLLSVDGGNAFRPLTALPDTATAQVGTTNFVLEDSKGCELSQAFEFDPAPVGEIQITPTFEVITLGDSVEIAVLTNLEASGYQVVPGPETLLSEPSFFVAPDTTTRYLITAVDDAGCTVSGEALIVVDRFVPLFAPSAFSPNQDGTNDVYRIYGTRNVVSFSDFSIFDRWGNRVYDFAGPVGPRDENWGWDGRTVDGRLRQSGAYVFSVTVTFTDGSTKVVKGDLVLVR